MLFLETGVSRRLIRKADFVIGMPPSGAIDTLNVGTAVAAFLSAVHILQNSTKNSLQICQRTSENNLYKN
jgi:phosphoribosylcarboxyaminoimidazole (NCAIR) mutase